MNREVLEQYVEYFNKQEGRLYPCSNQKVVCAIVTKDKNKALSVMNKRGAIVTKRSSNDIEWKINNERWLWKDWNVNYRGYRFYKLLIDKDISEECLNYVVASASLYCCLMEII